MRRLTPYLPPRNPLSTASNYLYNASPPPLHCFSTASQPPHNRFTTASQLLFNCLSTASQLPLNRFSTANQDFRDREAATALLKREMAVDWLPEYHPPSIAPPEKTKDTVVERVTRISGQLLLQVSPPP